MAKFGPKLSIHFLFPVMCCFAVICMQNTRPAHGYAMQARSLSFSATNSGNTIQQPSFTRRPSSNPIIGDDDNDVIAIQNKIRIAADNLSHATVADYEKDDEDEQAKWARRTSVAPLYQVTTANTNSVGRGVVSNSNEQVKPAAGEGGCSFPDAWLGEWFQQRVSAPVIISAHAISEKGSCERELTNSIQYTIGEPVAFSGNNNQQVQPTNKMRQFILRNRDTDNVPVCIVVFQQHNNILQYKEAWCDDEHCEAESLCARITPDSVLYTMFRINAEPVPCPLKAPYDFTFTSQSSAMGGANCGESDQTSLATKSRIDQCTNTGHLKLYYAASSTSSCESQRVTLKCLAHWHATSTAPTANMLSGSADAGGQRAQRTFFVAEIEQSDMLGNTKPMINEDRFRCFSYQTADSTTTNMVLAQSESAFCQDLLALSRLEDAYTVHRLTPTSYPRAQCAFPSWLTTSETTQMPKHWLTLSSSPNDELKYSFSHFNNRRNRRFSTVDHGQMTVFSRRSPKSTSRQVAVQATCISSTSPKTDKSTDHVQIVAFVVENCANGYKCFAFKRHGDQLVQVRQGKLAPTADDACGSIYFIPERELQYESDLSGSSSLSRRWQTLIVANAEARPCVEFYGNSVDDEAALTKHAFTGGRYAVPHQHMPAALLSGSARARESLYSCYDAYQVDVGCGNDAGDETGTMVRVGKHAESRNNCLPAMMKALGMGRSYQDREFMCHGGWQAHLSESKYSSSTDNFARYAENQQQQPAASAFLQPSTTAMQNIETFTTPKLLPPLILLNYLVISDVVTREKICLIFHKDLQTQNVSLLTAPACLEPEQIDLLVASKRRSAFLPSTPTKLAAAGESPMAQTGGGRFGARNAAFATLENSISHSTCAAVASGRSRQSLLARSGAAKSARFLMINFGNSYSWTNFLPFISAALPLFLLFLFSRALSSFSVEQLLQETLHFCSNAGRVAQFLSNLSRKVFSRSTVTLAPWRPSRRRELGNKFLSTVNNVGFYQLNSSAD